MKKRSLWLIALVAILILLCCPVYADDVDTSAGVGNNPFGGFDSASNLTFTLNSDGQSYSVTDCKTSASGALTIPATYNCKPVTAIGREAFFMCSSLTSVTIPNNVVSIDSGAFYKCSSLASITIPDSVTNIGYGAFYDCSSLTSITIPNSVTTIGGSVFTFCRSLSSVTIPDSVTTIGDYAFQHCTSLTFVTIGDGITAVGDCMFYECSSLTFITIGDSVTTIGSEAFLNCTSLTFATIGDNVTTIGSSAFAGCSRLTAVTIPNSVTAIDHSAFAACSSLTYVTIGDSVTTIGDYAFQYCSGLTSVTIPDSVTAIGGYAFDSCSSLTSATIGDSVTTISDSAFSNCTSLTFVTIGDSVTTIGSEAFISCISLTSVTIPDSVTTIGRGAFHNCSSLTSATIGDSVTTISDSAFSDCTSLTDLIIPDSVTAIGYAAFAFCCRLNSVTIPERVISIGDSAFDHCDSLTSVTIPNSVTTIGNSAFMYCSSLKDVYYIGTKAQWDAISIGRDNNCLTNANIHYGLFTLLPANQTVKLGQKASFTVAVNGEAKSYRWQYSKDDGATWLDATSAMTGYKSDTLTLEATKARNGYLLRCKVTDQDGNEIFSEAALLTVEDSVIFTAQPQAETVKLGSRAAFTVSAEGEIKAYQWQYQMVENGPWWNCTQYTQGYNTTVLNVIGAENRQGFLYRCRVTDTNGNKYYSNTAELTVDIPESYAVLSQPKDTWVMPGKTTTFRVETQGEGLTYQWEYHKGVDKSGPEYYWIAMGSTPGCKTDTLTIAGISGSINRDGWAYRCVVTDPNGYVYTTDHAFLYVASAQIDAQPEDVNVAPGEKANFHAEVSGEVAKYQWQYSKDGGKSWYNSSSATQGYNTATLTVVSVSGSTNRNGFMYRCIITDSQGNQLITAPAKLTVE